MNKGLVTVSLLLCFVTPSLWVSFKPPVLAQTTETQKAEAERLPNLCREHLSKNQPEAAIQSCQQAGIRQILAEAEQKPASPQKTEADRLLELGIQQAQTSQYTAAIASLQKALDLYREIKDRQGEANSLNNLGLAYNSLGQYPKAIEFYQQSLAIFKDIGDREGEGLTLSNLGVSYEAQNQPGLAIVFYKQSVIVREGIRQDLRVLEKELQQSYTETVAGTYRNLADLLLSQDRIFEAQQVLELLKLQEIQDFTRSQRARGEMAKVVMLPQEQAIIDSYGKVVTFGAEIAKCEQTNCPQLSALRNQRDTLKRQYDQDLSTWETAIRQRTAQDDQFLRPISFDRTAERIIQASDKYNSIVRENRPNDAQGIYPGNQFLDRDFTFLSLRDNLKGRKLLHIATHGKFVPGDQSLSYLVWGNGDKLTIKDINNLGTYLRDIHLVVLSACETALGDSFLTDPKQEEGIEINALSFYFLVAGAKTVMASLWRVDDTSTSLLMQRFYCTMANGNTTMTKSQALKKAQLSLLEGTKMPNCPAVSAGEQDFSHPHYWAPFILIGNGL